MKSHYAVAALLLAALPGCSQQTLNSAQSDANYNAAVISRKAQEAEKRARPEFAKADLQGRVQTALAVAHLPSTVHVRADAGGVYLRGTVNGRQDKARAGQIARDTLGPDKAVHNEIQVSGN